VAIGHQLSAISHLKEDLMTDSYKTEQLRNVALIAHGSAGKTSLAEAMIFDTGATSRLGKVEDGTTVSDYDAEEIRRKISLNTSIIPCEWNGHKINVLDTPGYIDFVGEVKGAVRVADAAVVVLDAVSGVEVGTELAWGFADGQNLPRLVFVNKMDRENANFTRTLEQLGQKFEGNMIPVQWPVSSKSQFKGVVDLVSMKAYLGDKAEEGEIPAGLEDEIGEYRLR
jgi:elongation factor G